MTPEAKEARRAYKREWNRRNRDKNRAYQQKYWEKKAAEVQADALDDPKDGRGEEK